MNALPPPERHALGEAPLVDLVDFKWLMIAEGLAVNLDRLRDDVDYARRVFQAADDSGNPMLRRIAAELRQRLGAPAA